MKLKHLLIGLVVVFGAGKALGQSPDQEIIYKAPKYEKEWMLPGVHPDRIVVNFGEDPTTTASVTWRTSTEVDTAYAEIAKATAAPKFWRTAKRDTAQTTLLDGTEILDAGLTAHYHSVTFSDLEPNTLYGYRVGDGDRWSEWIQFKTASESPDKFSFIYVGDAQNYILELWSRLIRQGFQKAPDASFIIHAGDLVGDAHSEKEWEEWFRAGSFIHSMIPGFLTPGNHEYGLLYGGPEDSIRQLSYQWRPQFTLPENGPEGMDELTETTYYMDFQGVRFISLNSNVHHAEQAVWLREVLTDNPNRWTIVTYHHPLFSASAGRSNSEWRALLKPIFDEFQVDLVLQGHDHSYARGRVAPTGNNLTSGVNKLDQTGTMYVVSVSGGKMYRVEQEGWEKWGAIKDRDAENTQLVQVITVDTTTLNYYSYTATGELYDAFDLIKNENGPNTLVDRKDEGVAARYHHNTVDYFDTLPADIREELLSKYADFKITKVLKRLDGSNNFFYQVGLDNENTGVHIELKINEVGVILREKIYD